MDLVASGSSLAAAAASIHFIMSYCRVSTILLFYEFSPNSDSIYMRERESCVVLSFVIFLFRP